MIALRSVTKSYRTPKGRRYVFRGLNFAFPDRCSIGLIGPNGAGKSTLLRLLGGIDVPDSGHIERNVSISWPVGLSGGFQGSLSGRDNARFVCRINGAVGDAMREKIAFVEEFADIGEYFDLPFRTYSSGMRARVAFGLSLAFDFDYYLLDEIMAVGDADFKKKSEKVFAERLARSKVIVCSHSMTEIRKLCDVVILLQHGEVKLFEDLEAGIAAYRGTGRPQ